MTVITVTWKERRFVIKLLTPTAGAAQCAETAVCRCWAFQPRTRPFSPPHQICLFNHTLPLLPLWKRRAGSVHTGAAPARVCGGSAFRPLAARHLQTGQTAVFILTTSRTRFLSGAGSTGTPPPPHTHTCAVEISSGRSANVCSGPIFREIRSRGPVSR